MSDNRTSNGVTLVVDDDPVARMIMVELIADQGLRVLEAATAQDAIDILEARDDIAVVITDIVMPGDVDGLALVRLVHERWPPIELIVTSGQRHLHDRDLPDAGTFLAKPYGIAEFEAVFHSKLDRVHPL